MQLALDRTKRGLGWAASLTMALMGIYTVSLGTIPVVVNRTLFVVLCLILVYTSSYDSDEDVGVGKRSGREAWEWLRWAVLLGLLATIGYILIEAKRIADRVPYLDDILAIDYVFGVFLILVLLDGTRRVAGWGLTSVVALFVVYAFLGKYFGPWMSHRGAKLGEFIDLQVLSTSGILGVTMGAVVDFVFYFLLFAAFFEVSGGGQLFIDLAQAAFGRFRGGSAKTAVVASSLMGTINGSSVANVVGTGTFTIPMMKRAGYPAYFAGAVEAASSTGGQIMPPVMGAVAFVMAEMTGIEYADVVISAAIPAILYYVGVFLMVDMKAQQQGLKGETVPMDQIKASIRQRFHQLFPLVVLIYFIFSGRSLAYAASAAAVSVVVLSFLNSATRIGPRKLVAGLVRTGRSLPSVVLPCAAAGIIVGVVTTTGLGGKVAAALVAISGQSLFLALIFTLLACLVFGMGMPAVTAYILPAVFLGPALVKMGIPTIAAHLFILYYACLAHVTPPVAVASYAAAGIARAPAGKVGWTALMLTSAGFIVPFAFVYNPALVGLGTVPETVAVTATALLGVYALSGALIGLYLLPCRWYERALGLAAGVMLISPDHVTDVAGAAVLGMLLTLQYLRRKSGRADLLRSDRQPDESETAF